MTEIVTKEDRRKALFLYEYKKLCVEHGFFVVHISNPETEYSPFSLVYLESNSQPVFELSLEEMRIESVRHISKG